jgi:hypothetical protein
VLSIRILKAGSAEGIGMGERTGRSELVCMV